MLRALAWLSSAAFPVQVQFQGDIDRDTVEMEVSKVIWLPPNHPVVMEDHDFALKPMVLGIPKPGNLQIDSIKMWCT